MSNMVAGVELRLSRTPAEAHLFMDLHPCEVCGKEEFERAAGLLWVDGWLASRYTGACPDCGDPREFTFRVPDDTPLPDPDNPSFGGETPSELLDAGEWVWVADYMASCVPAEPDGLDHDERLWARRELRRAAAAVAEARKFAPPNFDAVPAEVLWSPTGRAFYAQDPYRFEIVRLNLVESVYRELADGFV
jgi:hypothetical protein